MIQSLIRYYEAVSAGEGASDGWSRQRVSYAIVIDGEGRLKDIALVGTVVEGKSKPEPQMMQLPARVRRTSGVSSNFIAEKIDYLFGVDEKGANNHKAVKCFEACKALHLDILKEAHSPCANAVKAFFENWQPENWQSFDCLAKNLPSIAKESNIAVRCDFHGQSGKYAHEDEDIRAAWDNHYNASDGASDEDAAVCLATGVIGPAERTHPGIRGAGGSESSLISFNNPAFNSYGKEQSYNAPMSKYAAFAYTEGLNRLLKDEHSRFRMGDTTVVFWTENGSGAAGSLFSDFAYYGKGELEDKVRELTSGLVTDYNDEHIDPDMPFYILGLDPAKGRLSVGFFLRGTFGNFMRNMEKHRQRTTIDGCEGLSVRQMLDAMHNSNSKEPVSRMLRVETLKAVLNDTRYPAAILNGVELRIAAEHEVTPQRAAIIKAYYMKNKNKDVPEEVLILSLNRESTNIPYSLGRLFAVLEKAQQDAVNPSATIVDRYFSSASSTPATVFPTLVNLAQNHLSKLNDGPRIYLDKEIGEILDNLGETWPAKLSQAEQGAFQLGYYHEKKYLYTAKKEK